MIACKGSNEESDFTGERALVAALNEGGVDNSEFVKRP